MSLCRLFRLERRLWVTSTWVSAYFWPNVQAVLWFWSLARFPVVWAVRWCGCSSLTLMSWIKKKKGSIDRRGTCINISDEMIDDRISKSLWHRTKIAFARECLAVRGAWRPAPGELIAAVGGQWKLGRIKVIKELQINNAFILDLLAMPGSHTVSRKTGGGRGWNEPRSS